MNDPLEPMNRVVFDFNQFVDRILLKPLAKGYRYVMPDFAQDVVHNMLRNAGEPVTFMNAALQGRVKDAQKTFNRFLVNTITTGGIGDVASAGGLSPVDADFGQTLHVWGAPEGPYLVLPILGPSNPRDAVGFAVDSIAEPWPYLAEGLDGSATRNRLIISEFGATALDKRSRSLDALDALEKGSIDFYAQLRSVSRQYRHKQLGIKDGQGLGGAATTEGTAVQGAAPLGN
jgi:phospholipid-binding lipoprotein MlaA